MTLRYRSIEQTVQSKGFEDLWPNLSEEDVMNLGMMVEKGDDKALRKFISRHGKQEYKNMPITELRLLGRRLHVTYYARLPKLMLVEKIMEAKETVDERFALKHKKDGQ
jgi:hypothetical protein